MIKNLKSILIYSVVEKLCDVTCDISNNVKKNNFTWKRTVGDKRIINVGT